MQYERRFKFLVCAPVFDAEDLEGQRLAQIVAEIEKIGLAWSRPASRTTPSW